MYQAVNRSAAAGVGYNVPDMVPAAGSLKSQSVSDAISMELSGQLERLAQLGKRQAMLVERLYGPRPENAQNESGPQPAGSLGQIHGQLQYMSALINRLHAQFDDLERLA